jgi:hypothetical protein
MIRVYRLPEKLTDGFCFGGGRPIQFLNMDWFDEPPPEMKITRAGVEAEVRGKCYYDPTARYLILDDRPGETFVLDAAPQPTGGDHGE